MKLEGLNTQHYKVIRQGATDHFWFSSAEDIVDCRAHIDSAANQAVEQYDMKDGELFVLVFDRGVTVYKVERTQHAHRL